MLYQPIYRKTPKWRLSQGVGHENLVKSNALLCVYPVSIRCVGF